MSRRRSLIHSTPPPVSEPVPTPLDPPEHPSMMGSAPLMSFVKNEEREDDVAVLRDLPFGPSLGSEMPFFMDGGSSSAPVGLADDDTEGVPSGLPELSWLESGEVPDWLETMLREAVAAKAIEELAIAGDIDEITPEPEPPKLVSTLGPSSAVATPSAETVDPSELARLVSAELVSRMQMGVAGLFVGVAITVLALSPILFG